MIRLITIAVAFLMLLAPAPALAAVESQEHRESDEPRYGCSAELQVCLDWMAKYYIDRGWAGMQLDVDGVVYTVTQVHKGSPAAKAGIKPGDLLVAVNGVEFGDEKREQLIEMQQQMKPGTQFTYTVKRKGKRRNVDFVLVEMPLDVAAQMVGMHLLTDHVDLNLALNSESD